jgi:hypothetical protein
MDKTRLFEFLSTQNASVLLSLLKAAYDEMDYDQRQAVFWRVNQTLPPAPVDGETLLEEVEEFQRESLAGQYYAPFNINSKNWTHVPEETREWFERLGDLLQASAQLTAQGDHLGGACPQFVDLHLRRPKSSCCLSNWIHNIGT